jgi:toxin ParE1/3/4
MTAVRVSPRAAADLEQIGEYIELDNPERAASFVAELENACHRIGDNPKAYPLRSDIRPGVRLAVHRKYVIAFRILANEVRVERVLHGARDLRRAMRDE